MTAIKTALIGYGMSGACFHAPLLRQLPDYRIGAVVTTRPEAVRRDFPDVAIYPTLDALLAGDDAELCVVCTPNAAHAPQARDCLAAGRHVVVEKPFVLDVDDGIGLIRLARERDRVLTVYQSRRWDGDFLTLSGLAAAGELGEVHTLISHYDRYRPQPRDRWRERDEPGAGIVWDIASHLIDQALQLFGLPQRVQARLACLRPGAAAVDHFHLLLDYGAQSAILHGDCLTVAGGPRFQLHGSRGSFVKYGMDPQETLLRAGRGPETPGWGRDDPACFGLLSRADGEACRPCPSRPGMAVTSSSTARWHRPFARGARHRSAPNRRWT
jgi:scyllo-inositol 2-dehydrogenase (NADP+)